MSEVSTKPPIVLIHGMWSTPAVFDDLKSFFVSHGFSVYTPSLPAHFDKQTMTQPDIEQLKQTSFENYVESILTFVQSFDHKPVLLGHSMGGLIAQVVASKTSCLGLILLSSAAPAGINGWSWSVIRTFGHNILKFPLWNACTELKLTNIRYGIANAQSAELQQDIDKISTLESGRVTWQLGMWFLYRKPKNQVNYTDVNCPVLIIGGDHDKITPIKIQKVLHEKYRERSTLKIIQGACHWTVGGRFFQDVTVCISQWLKTTSVLNSYSALSSNHE
ncbi:alpha/beta hydrolase [Aliikangiella marina]|uniref:Alpha/beta hydrolase n=1 Tax=Aliikangiella marina TaxID=1712262 RepID=A0A545T7H7_9GAMM|nr:alpha/beta hydrolase [Aliikangiella marina]TQV73142.1 alpha/beta hydrolase [Aliikangiella marina]